MLSVFAFQCLLTCVSVTFVLVSAFLFFMFMFKGVCVCVCVQRCVRVCVESCVSVFNCVLTGVCKQTTTTKRRQVERQ